MKREIHRLALATILAGIFCNISNAQEIRGSFNGILLDDISGVAPNLSSGDELTFDFSYNPFFLDGLDTFELGSRAQYNFLNGGASLSISSNGFSYQASDNFTLGISDNERSSSSISDQFSIGTRKEILRSNGDIRSIEEFSLSISEFAPLGDRPDLVTNLDLPKPGFFRDIRDKSDTDRLSNFGSLNIFSEDNFEFGLLFEFDLNSFTAERIGPNTIEPQIAILLQPGVDASAGFSIATAPDGRQVQVSNSNSTHPAANLTYDVDQIANEVEKIFGRSNASAVKVYTDPSEVPSNIDVYKVQFIEGLERYDGNGNGVASSTARGYAYDISFFNGPDIFDVKSGGNVAVFINNDEREDIFSLAETVAHEVGHGLGLYHVEAPSEGNAVIPIDGIRTTSENAPTFLNKPARRTDGGLGTQNPEYAIRRFALGEGSSIANPFTGEFLVPGSQDRLGSIGVSAIDSIFRFTTPGIFFDSLFLGYGANSFDDEFFLTQITESSFSLMDDINYQLFGSSSGSSGIDLVFGVDDFLGARSTLTSSDFFNELTVFSITPGGLSPQAKGSFDVLTVSTISPATVPIPAPFWLLLSGIGMFLTRGKFSAWSLRCKAA